MKAYSCLKAALWMTGFWLLSYLAMAGLIALDKADPYTMDFMLPIMILVGLALLAVTLGIVLYMAALAYVRS